jgi:hypothetical protein
VGVSAPRHAPLIDTVPLPTQLEFKWPEPFGTVTSGSLSGLLGTAGPRSSAAIRVVEVAGWATSTLPAGIGFVKPITDIDGSNFRTLGGVLSSSRRYFGITHGHSYATVAPQLHHVSSVYVGPRHDLDTRGLGSGPGLLRAALQLEFLCIGYVNPDYAVVRNGRTSIAGVEVLVGVDVAMIDLVEGDSDSETLARQRLPELAARAPGSVVPLEEVVRSATEGMLSVRGFGAVSGEKFGFIGPVPTVIRPHMASRVVHGSELELAPLRVPLADISTGEEFGTLVLVPLLSHSEPNSPSSCFNLSSPVFIHGDSGAFICCNRPTFDLVGLQSGLASQCDLSGNLVWGLSLISLACPWGATLTAEAVRARLSEIKSP